MSEEGQCYRTLAQQALEMKYPRFELSFPDTRNLEELARLYYTLAETIKRIGDKFDIPIGLRLVDKYNVECRPSPIGCHEMKEIKDKTSNTGVLMCIHCGRFVYKTKRSEKEISAYMKGRKFKVDSAMPLAPEDELPF